MEIIIHKLLVLHIVIPSFNIFALAPPPVFLYLTCNLFKNIGMLI